MRAKKILIYCDGACSGNHTKENLGGWGAILIYGDYRKEIYGGEKNTTNQKMELTACIKALELIKKNIPISIYSDSSYLVNCFQQKWFVKWKKNHWQTMQKEPVKNKELWEPLINFYEKYEITFHKVLGHSGDHYNEIADKLAKKGIQKLKEDQ